MFVCRHPPSLPRRAERYGFHLSGAVPHQAAGGPGPGGAVQKHLFHHHDPGRYVLRGAGVVLRAGDDPGR